MNKYKPATKSVDALQFDGTAERGDALIGLDNRLRWATPSTKTVLLIECDGVRYRVLPDHWIVRGTTGRIWPVSSEDFEDTYEAEEEKEKKKKTEQKEKKPTANMAKAVSEAVEVPGIPEDMLGGGND